MKKILMTGGGSAGHVTPNLALLPLLSEAGYEAEYIGGREGIERELTQQAGIPYHSISTGKLRRDRILSFQTIGEVARAVHGVSDAVRVIRSVKPDVIFSKGGFVGLPVAAAGRICRVNVVLHESDMSPGLANRLSMGFASAVCASFPETMGALPQKKAVLTGNPIRRELLTGDKQKGLSLCSFTSAKPVVVVTGGSLGSQAINEAVRGALPYLTANFNVAHLCGKGKRLIPDMPGYTCFEYMGEGLNDLLAAAAIIVSRAGSNSINEFLALKKPSLLIPLENRATRGDQAQNAASFDKQGFSMILREANLTPDSLAEAINNLYANRHSYIQNMEKSPQRNAAEEILKVILQYT